MATGKDAAGQLQTKLAPAMQSTVSLLRSKDDVDAEVKDACRLCLWLQLQNGNPWRRAVEETTTLKWRSAQTSCKKQHLSCERDTIGQLVLSAAE